MCAKHFIEKIKGIWALVLSMKNIPILMYHHVVPSVEVGSFSPFAVSQKLFLCQMDWLNNAGFQTITFEQLFALRDQDARGAKNSKLVIITFDDCSTNLLDQAVPELMRRGMTATFFAVAGKPGGINDWDADNGAPKIPLMSRNDLKSLSDNGFEIGSHGLSHPNLRRCLPDQIRHELKNSKEILEDIIGRSIHFLAYPYGKYPVGYANYCREAGYAAAVSIFSNARTVTDDPYCMRRVLVHEGDHGVRFRFKLSALYLMLRRYSDWRVLRMEHS